MITYVYKCTYCDETFEIQQRITDDALTVCDCPDRGELQKVLQSQRSQFLNDGWGDMERKGHTHPASREKKKQNLGEL